MTSMPAITYLYILPGNDYPQRAYEEIKSLSSITQIYMLGLFFVYFIGNAFYSLAGQYRKHQWGYAILGVAAYYGGTLAGGVILGIMAEFSLFDLDTFPEYALGLIALPVGALTCWGTYRLLKKKWSNAGKPTEENVLDGDILDAT